MRSRELWEECGISLCFLRRTNLRKLSLHVASEPSMEREVSGLCCGITNHPVAIFFCGLERLRPYFILSKDKLRLKYEVPRRLLGPMRDGFYT